MSGEPQRHLQRGLLWLGSGSLVARLLDAGTLLILMQFLTKEEIGIATLAWTVTVFVEAFNGLGMSGTLVQAQNLREEEPHVAFWYVMATAVAFTALVALLAPRIASFYGAEVLVPLVQLSALKLLFVGAALVPLALLSRELRFADVSAVTTTATLLASLLTIGLAWGGAGVWAPVAGNTAHGLLQWLGASIARPMLPRLRFRAEGFSERIRFGLKIGVAAAAYQLYRNVDYLIVGRVLGIGVLGIYRVAFDFAMSPALAVVQVATRTALPVYSRIADDRDALVSAFLWTTRGLALLIVPVVALLHFAGADLLLWIGGGKWGAAVGALSVLAWASLVRALAHLFPMLLYARGRAGLAALSALFHLGWLSAAMVLALSALGERLGLMAACFTWLAGGPVMLAFDFWLARRVVRVPLAGYLRALGGPLAGLLVLGVVLGALSWLSPLPPGAPSFLAMLVAGLLTYAAFVRGALRVDPRHLVGPGPGA